MILRTSKSRSNERGAALVEFALVAPVLIMIMMGVVQLGLLIHQQQGIHAAAREGARRASFPESSVDTVASSVDSALNGINLANAKVVTIVTPNGSTLILPTGDGTRVPCDEAVDGADSVTVIVEVAATLDIPFFAGQNVNLSGEGTFKCEYFQ